MAAYLYVSGIQRRPNTPRIRRNPLEFLTEQEIIMEYRLDRRTIGQLSKKLSDKLKHKTKRSSALTVTEQILIALKTLGSGSFQNSAKDNINVSQPTVSLTLTRFLEALLECTADYIYMPTSQQQLNKNKLDFYEVAELPNVVGAVDGTHIPIIAPKNIEHLFVNRKNFHSINVQVRFLLGLQYSFIAIAILQVSFKLFSYGTNVVININRQFATRI